MAASSVQNPAPAAESKSAKKKKAKADRTASPAPVSAAAASEKAVSVAPTDGPADDLAEPAYLRELAKNIRNLNKKITNASKTDNVINENKDKSLDELVALKIINTDQKAAHLKKPLLQAQVVQLEEQYNQFKKLDQDYRQRLAAEKAEVTKALTEQFEKEKADAVRETAEKAAADAKQALHDSLLTLSQFLRLAAARRADEQDQELDENLALEGVLLQVYAGDESAVATMLKLVEGVDEATKSVSNEPLETTFARVKAASQEFAVPLLPAESPEEATAEPSAQVETDPTIAHASLTEIQAGDDTALVASAPLTNGFAANHEQAEQAAATEASGPLANADVADSAANAAAESQWDAAANGVKDLSMSQEWVEVPRDVAETETGLTATPAAPANTQSWADEQPDHPPPVLAAATPGAPTPNAIVTTNGTPNDDGFHQVQRHTRARSERDAGWRGGRGGGGFRGRGRGDGRGRGRGRGGGGNVGNGGNPAGNGGYGGYRGPRRTDEA